MPFTPYHMGPGILLKALLQGSFSLMVFGWAQILMDLQPLFAMVSGSGRLHGFSHTYFGGTLIAIFAAVTGKYLAAWMLTIVRVAPVMLISWRAAFLGAFLGTCSHIILDSIMHSDVQPWLPLSSTNAMLGFIPVTALHRLCLYSGMAGAVGYFVIAKLLARNRN